jgi:hypothetical protein
VADAELSPGADDGSVRASYCRGLQRPFCDRLVEEAAEAKEKATAAIAIEH